MPLKFTANLGKQNNIRIDYLEVPVRANSYLLVESALRDLISTGQIQKGQLLKLRFMVEGYTEVSTIEEICFIVGGIVLPYYEAVGLYKQDDFSFNIIKGSEYYKAGTSLT